MSKTTMFCWFAEHRAFHWHWQVPTRNPRDSLHPRSCKTDTFIQLGKIAVRTSRRHENEWGQVPFKNLPVCSATAACTCQAVARGRRPIGHAEAPFLAALALRQRLARRRPPAAPRLGRRRRFAQQQQRGSNSTSPRTPAALRLARRLLECARGRRRRRFAWAANGLLARWRHLALLRVSGSPAGGPGSAAAREWPLARRPLA